MTAAIEKARAPFADELSRVIGHTESLLYRRDTFRGTFCDLICTALMAERDAEIAFSPGFRWGTTILPGSPITVEDVFNNTAIGYPQVYRTTMTGGASRACWKTPPTGSATPILISARRRHGPLRRAALPPRPKKPLGSRISSIEHSRTGKPLDPAKSYVVAGWGSVADQVEGPPVWEVIETHLGRIKTVRTRPQTNVRVVTG